MQLDTTDRALLEGELTELARHTRLLTLARYPQHGETCCLTHSVAVAYFSLLLARRLHLRVCARSLVVGALLHDYFLYDWHEPDPSHRLHGFHHPRRALSNARRDYHLDAVEADIIRRHMFPLTPVPPKYTESALVCFVDKICSLQEVFRPHPYGGAVDGLLAQAQGL